MSKKKTFIQALKEVYQEKPHLAIQFDECDNDEIVSMQWAFSMTELSILNDLCKKYKKSYSIMAIGCMVQLNTLNIEDISWIDPYLNSQNEHGQTHPNQ